MQNQTLVLLRSSHSLMRRWFLYLSVCYCFHILLLIQLQYSGRHRGVHHSQIAFYPILFPSLVSYMPLFYSFQKECLPMLFLTTFYSLVPCGITMQFTISLYRLFLRTTNLEHPLKPECTIPCVRYIYSINLLLFSINLSIRSFRKLSNDKSNAFDGHIALSRILIIDAVGNKCI